MADYAVTNYNQYNMYQSYDYAPFNSYQKGVSAPNVGFRGQADTVSNQTKSDTKKQGLSTGAKVAIGAGIATALAVGADFLFCKGKHVKSFFGKSSKSIGSKGGSSTGTGKPNANPTNAPHSTTSTPANKQTATTNSSQASGRANTSNIQTPKEPTGADILAEQNRGMPGQDVRTSREVTIKSNSGITSNTELEAEYNRLATGINGTNTPDNVASLKTLFEQDTGLVLHCPANRTNLFGMALSAISKDVKQGTFPKDIKHVLIGHGLGSSLPSKTGTISWQLEGLSFAEGKPVNIFEYINKNIPQGEKVLVCSCEEGATIANKAGIGRHVELSLKVPTEPAKIVKASEDKIIGHYTSYDPKFPETGVVYY